MSTPLEILAAFCASGRGDQFVKGSPGFIRWWWVILLLAVGAGVVIFGQEMRELASIALSRALDKADTAWRPAVLERDYDEVVREQTSQVIEIETYLDSLKTSVRQTPETLGLDFSTESDYLRSCAKMRSALAESLSYPPPSVLSPPVAPSLRRLAEDDLATYYEMSVPVLERVNARGLFMVPRSAVGKMPLIIAAHGRGGLPDRPKSGKLRVVSRSNRDLARGALEKGYAVWEPTFVFYASDRPEDIRDRLEMRAREWGTTLPAIEIAKVVGGLDAILRTQEIDPARVAMVGMSYGGFYTLYTTALEERIRVAVVAAYFNDREEVLNSAEPFGMTDWRFPKSLSVFHDANMVALICPRPLQIQTGNHDQLFPIAGARRIVPDARRVYERLQRGERFSFVEFVGRHEFNGEAAWHFIEKQFNSASGGEATAP